jgi:penicillin amidase
MDPYSGVWREVGRGDFRGSMEVRVSGVENKIIVVFNKYIVPHIFANSYRDATYALGYIYAYHRL